MSDYHRKRASRLREWKDARDEYKETGSKEAAERMWKASRKGTASDFRHASEIQYGEGVVEEKLRRERILKKFGIEWKKEEE